MFDPMPDQDAQEIQAALFAGHKIEAIKKYRQLTGKGLKESKDFVEALEAQLRLSSPERFTAPPGGKGCGSAVLCLLLIGALATFAVSF